MRLVVEEDVQNKPVRVTAYRLNEDTLGFIAGQKKVLKKGTIVFHDRDNDIVACIVLSGDRIIKPDNPLYQTVQVQRPTDDSFEKRMSQLLPRVNINNARLIYKQEYPAYETILRKEYEELLGFKEITIAEQFAYYLAWTQQEGLPIVQSSMHAFFDKLLKELHKRKGQQKTPEENEQPDGVIDKLASFFKETTKTIGDAFSKESGDSKNMAYHDELASEQVEAQVRDYGVIWAIIRQQGRFFDNYTYNRLSLNYSAKVSATVVGKKERAIIQPLALDNNIPDDVFERIEEQQNLPYILNRTTQFESPNLEKELKNALVESLELVDSQKVKHNDFQIRYDSNGIKTILFKNQELKLSRVTVDPKWLKKVPEVQTITIGSVSFTINLKDYFTQYARLEEKNQAASQNIFVYDQKEKKLIEFRNPLWFVEEDVDLYKKIAQGITDKSSHKNSLVSLGSWIQQKFDYIQEFSEINKICLATLIDRGGDCEDATVQFITLARALGHGHSVAAVLFENHVAPIIKGNYGGTVFHINGEEWTLYEMATPRGQVLTPGQTDKARRPMAFLFDKNTFIPAPGFTVARNTKHSELEKKLVEVFEAKAAETLSWLKQAEDELTKDVTAEKALQYTSQMPEKFEALRKTFTNIIATGKISPEVQNKHRQLQDAAVKVSDLLSEFHKKEHAKLKWQELKNQPEHVQEALRIYTQNEKHLLENIIEASNKILALMEKWRQVIEPSVEQQNLNETLRISQEYRNKMVQVINQSGVSLNHDHMYNQYHQVLKYIPNPGFQKSLEHDFTEKTDLLNKLIWDPYNVVAGVIDTINQ